MTPSHGAAPRIGRRRTERLLPVLRTVRRWRLAPERWIVADGLLAELAVAVEAGDVGTVDEKTAELELIGRRVGRIAPDEPPPADDGKMPAPDTVRDRVVALVHVLDPEGAPPAASAEQR
ncbi:CATRA system-associated protein [Streptomyces sp. NPDC049040]|uniref:CATRA system-associated protein n=1 Tax=Streptomyces sp. NPDC049040 TaxID=3365593 RepID=UPI003723119E